MQRGMNLSKRDEKEGDRRSFFIKSDVFLTLLASTTIAAALRSIALHRRAARRHLRQRIVQKLLVQLVELVIDPCLLL
jgi:DNA-binding transcriptional regulator GbsR (MarR family)